MRTMDELVGHVLSPNKHCKKQNDDKSNVNRPQNSLVASERYKEEEKEEEEDDDEYDDEKAHKYSPIDFPHRDCELVLVNERRLSLCCVS